MPDSQSELESQAPAQEDSPAVTEECIPDQLANPDREGTTATDEAPQETHEGEDPPTEIDVTYRPNYSTENYKIAIHNIHQSCGHAVRGLS